MRHRFYFNFSLIFSCTTSEFFHLLRLDKKNLMISFTLNVEEVQDAFAAAQSKVVVFRQFQSDKLRQICRIWMRTSF